MNTGDEGLRSILRFATGVTAAFVLCEALGWTPTFLAPVFVAVFLPSLPARPPLKMAISMVVVMMVASWFVYMIASLFHDAPLPLIASLGIVVFAGFYVMATGRAKLPALLLLICVTTIPVVATISPAQATMLPVAMVRGMALAMLVVQVVFVLWPEPPPTAAAPPATPTVSPALVAALGTAILLPLMMVYLLFGLTDAFPVLIATVVLVANFDPQRSRMQAPAMVAGNLVGGLLGVVAHVVLVTTPTLVFLTLLLFLSMLAFASRIAAGGPAGAVAQIACRAMLIIFGASIASGPPSLSLWLARLSQFVVATTFAVGMMSLIWHRATPAPSTSPRETTS